MKVTRADKLNVEVHLKKIRLEKGMTQDDLAFATRISSSRICKIEQGKEITNLIYGLRIASALGVSPYDIWKEKE